MSERPTGGYEVNRVWDGFDSIDKGLKTVSEQLRNARGDAPVSRHDIADIHIELSRIEAKHSRLEDRIDNVYKKIPIITAYSSAAVLLAMALILRLHRK